MTLEVVSFEKNENAGDLRAWASISVGKVVFHDLRIVHEPTAPQPIVEPPQRAWTDANGKICFGGFLFEFPPDIWAAIQKKVLLRFAEETGESYQ